MPGNVLFVNNSDLKGGEQIHDIRHGERRHVLSKRCRCLVAASGMDTGIRTMGHLND